MKFPKGDDTHSVLYIHAVCIPHPLKMMYVALSVGKYGFCGTRALCVTAKIKTVRSSMSRKVEN